MSPWFSDTHFKIMLVFLILIVYTWYIFFNLLSEELVLKKLLKKDAFTYYSILSICLWVVIVSLYMWWPIAGKAPVELWDGQSQHFVSFVYFGEYIREIIKNILIDHNFSIPTYDFRGASIILCKWFLPTVDCF